jgi:hypothetical protein
MGVLCFAAVPVYGAAMDMDFTIIAGSLTVDTSPDGIANPDPVTVNMDGTFGMTIYASDGHIGESDTFILRNSGMYNSEQIEISLMGLATAEIGVMSAIFKDFAPIAPGHIGPGGVGVIETDSYIEIVAIVSGLLNTTLDTKMWAGEPLPFMVSITTSVEATDVVTVNIHGTFGFEIGVTAITQTLTLDLIVDIVGTAHVVPDPALGGFTALGLAGAGAWLRRRR